MKRLRVGVSRHRADKAAEYRGASPLAIGALERDTIRVAIERNGRCRINEVQLADDGADALRLVRLTRKRDTIARIDLIITGKLNRTAEAHFTDKTADVAAICVPNSLGAGDLSALVLSQRELDCLADEATSCSGAVHREAGKIDFACYFNGRASARPNLAHNAHDPASGTFAGLNRSSWDIVQGADTQGRAIVDCANQQAGVSAGRTHGAA